MPAAILRFRFPRFRNFIDEQVSALIIDPVDSYGLTDILKNCQRAGNTGYFL